MQDSDHIQKVYQLESSLQKTDHLSSSPDAAQHKAEREQYLVKNQKSRSYDYALVNIKNILRIIK